MYCSYWKSMSEKVVREEILFLSTSSGSTANKKCELTSEFVTLKSFPKNDVCRHDALFCELLLLS